MRYLIYFSIVCIMGIALGAWSVFGYMVQLSDASSITIGSWSARPYSESLQPDPYSRARSSSEGTLSIGLAEGLAFIASHDSNGDRLRLECKYELAGKNPPSRLWTLVATDSNNRILVSEQGQKAALLYNQVVRFPDYSFSIELTDSPVAGNWLPISGSGEFKLIMRIYDTPIANNAGSISPTMPLIEKKGCSS